MAPYIQTNNEELYLYNNDVTYYVITCNSAFEYNNDVTYYVITRNYQWTPEILTNNLLEAGCTNKLCPFQYNVTLSSDERFSRSHNLLINLKVTFFDAAVGSRPNFARMCG